MNIVQRFSEQARRHPERIAIIERAHNKDVMTSYSDLEILSNRVAGLLRKNGIEKGDAVLVFAGMSANLYALLIGVWKAGAVAMFIDPSGGRRLLDASCQMIAPRAFWATSKAHLFRLFSGQIRSIPMKLSIGPRLLPAASWKSVLECPEDSRIADVGPDHPALYTFTSGTTGSPKAAIRTHGILLAQHDALIENIQLESGEVDLATLPIFALANLGSGLTTLIPDCDLRRPGAIKADKVMAQIRRFGPTRSAGSPSFFMRLSEYCQERDEALPFLKVFTGGAPVFPERLKQIAQAAPEADVCIVYGSSEAEPISHVFHQDIAAEDFRKMESGKGLLAGRAVPEASVRIIEDRVGENLFEMDEEAFGALCLSPGQAGEIVVSGRHALQGYVKGVGDAENMIKAGGVTWLRTGDAGYFDEQERLWLVGRCSSKIKGPEGWAYPFPIESSLSMDDRIEWSALVEVDGERILAIQLAKGVDGFELEELPVPQGVIDRVSVIPSMPLDARHNAKIDYAALKSILRKQRE